MKEDSIIQTLWLFGIILSLGYILVNFYRIVSNKIRITNKIEQTYQDLTTRCKKCESRSIQFFRRTRSTGVYSEYRGVLTAHPAKIMVMHYVRCGACNNIAFSHEDEVPTPELDVETEACILSEVEIQRDAFRKIFADHMKLKEDASAGCQGAFGILIWIILLAFFFIMMKVTQ